MNLTGKNVVVYGAGISGLSAYGLAVSHGAKAVIYDDNPEAPHATSCTGVFDNADIIVLSPGVEGGKDFLLDARLQNKIVISELQLASSICRAEQIAVTGTNGKTTTVMLIDHIFRCAGRRSHAVGNIGAAFSAIADKLDATETAVIEASSFQLESSSDFAPDTAVILNIEPDHLERHKTMKRYIAAKSNIFLRQSECDKIIYNEQDENVRSLIPLMCAKKIPFSTSGPTAGAYISSGFICYKGKPVVETEELDLKGRELENALAAVAVALSDDIPVYTLASALVSFKRPEFRRVLAARLDGVKVFNDSKSTNISSALSAVEGMDGPAVIILGGCLRNEDFNELFQKIDRDKAVGAIAFGQNAKEIISAAKKNGFSPIIEAEGLENAVIAGLELCCELHAQNLLFSPASKSFDSFSNFEERGRAFAAVVAKLSAK